MSKLTPAQLEALQKRRLQAGKIKINLQEIVIYCVFVAVLLYVANSTTDRRSYQYNLALRTRFGMLEQFNVVTYDYSNVHTYFRVIPFFWAAYFSSNCCI